MQELMSMNHHLLGSLGVGHDSLDDIFRTATACGQACKLTGAGGGGLALIWVNPQSDEEVIVLLKKQLTTKGFICWETMLGVKGVEVAEKYSLTASVFN